MENTKRTVVTKFKDTITLLDEYREIAVNEGNDEKVTAIDTAIIDMTDRMEKAVKKNNGEKKPTTASLENPKIANALYDALENEVGYTATQISNMGVEGITSASKATTILTILKNDGRVTNKKVKGVSTYYKA